MSANISKSLDCTAMREETPESSTNVNAVSPGDPGDKNSSGTTKRGRDEAFLDNADPEDVARAAGARPRIQSSSENSDGDGEYLLRLLKNPIGLQTAVDRVVKQYTDRKALFNPPLDVYASISRLAPLLGDAPCTFWRKVARLGSDLLFVNPLHMALFRYTPEKFFSKRMEELLGAGGQHVRELLKVRCNIVALALHRINKDKLTIEQKDQLNKGREQMSRPCSGSAASVAWPKFDVQLNAMILLEKMGATWFFILLPYMPDELQDVVSEMSPFSDETRMGLLHLKSMESQLRPDHKDIGRKADEMIDWVEKGFLNGGFPWMGYEGMYE